MSKTPHLWLGVLLALPLGSLWGQGTNVSYSDIVGYQKVSVPVGLSTAAFPLLNQDLVKTTVSSVASNSVTLSGQSNVGSVLSAGEPYYVEVYGGSLKGDRFDVDTAATITAANATVILNPSSLNNTFPVASISSNLNGATVALRKHITLEQVQQSSASALVGNNSASSADQIQLFNTTSRSYDSYFLRGDGITWRKVGTTDSANKVPIPPGVGVFISKRNSATELMPVGSVRQNDFSLPLVTGLQFRAPGFPMDVTPQGLGGTAANGWTGNNSASSADQIQIFNPGTRSYESYFLRGDGTTWRKVGTTDSVTNTIASSERAFFVNRRGGADANYLIVNPVPVSP